MWVYVAAGAAAMSLLGIAWHAWAHRINRELARTLVDVLRDARAVTLARVSYRLPRSDEPIADDLASLFESARRELEWDHWTILGDLMEQTEDGVGWGRTRWFIHDSEKIIGWFSVVRNPAAASLDPVMVLFSESEHGELFVTSRGGPRPVLAQAPAVQRTYCDWGEGLPEVLHRHLKAIDARRSRPHKLLPDLGAGPGLTQRIRDMNARWRTAQEPQALLLLDVHAMLDPQFEPLGPELLELMRGRA